MNRQHIKKAVIFTAIFLVLILVRIPYYLTHHIQEDAYITLRCAENLAETGVYGYNPGERVSASTSHLYVFLAAITRLAAGKTAFIPTLLVVNTILFVAGVYFLARLLQPDKGMWVLWIILSLLPVSLLISYSGMETSLLIFIIGLVLYLLHEQQHRWLALLSLVLIPWVRPDAIACSLIILFWESIRSRKPRFDLAGALLTGIGAFFAFNWLYFGAFLNNSILAKEQSRPAFSVERVFSTVKTVFFGENGGLFAPIRTKYLDQFGVVFLILFAVGMIIFLIQNRKNQRVFYSGLSIISMAILIPAAYSFGRVVFPWYFWPATFFGYAIVCTLVVDWLSKRPKGYWLVSVIVGLAVVGGMAAQWCYSYSWGMKEYVYRGEIGMRLAEMAHENDTLFLEPAGYIPYYSGLYTYDEAGLGSPLVLHYRDLYQTPWWIRFVEDAKPDWIIQREHFKKFTTYQGYTLNETEQQWFLDHYHLVDEISYQPQDFTTQPFLTRLLSMGSADSYLIYEINR